MTYTAEPDPACYPGSTVLINLLDIRDQTLLEEAELAFFMTRAEEPLPAGALDAQHYLRLHRHLFQDVYAWAGRIRAIRIGMGANWFCYPEYIAAEMQRVFAELGDVDALQHMPSLDFARRAGHFLADLNAIHPFREGNGRTQLSFLAMLAEHGGFSFDADVLQKERVIGAMIESFSGNEEPLIGLIEDIIA